jgi:nucleotide-binding universal stress UspA family protein
VVRMTRILGARIGRDPERAVMQALVEHERAAQARFTEDSGLPITGEVVQGDTAGRAMSRCDWQDSDVFVAASSSLGVLSRVFLGDLTHKLLRACTVPAVVLPRGFDPDGRIDS